MELPMWTSLMSKSLSWWALFLFMYWISINPFFQYYVQIPCYWWRSYRWYPCFEKGSYWLNMWLLFYLQHKHITSVSSSRGMSYLFNMNIFHSLYFSPLNLCFITTHAMGFPLDHFLCYHLFWIHFCKHGVSFYSYLGLPGFGQDQVTLKPTLYLNKLVESSLKHFMLGIESCDNYLFSIRIIHRMFNRKWLLGLGSHEVFWLLIRCYVTFSICISFQATRWIPKWCQSSYCRCIVSHRLALRIKSSHF